MFVEVKAYATPDGLEVLDIIRQEGVELHLDRTIWFPKPCTFFSIQGPIIPLPPAPGVV